MICKNRISLLFSREGTLIGTTLRHYNSSLNSPKEIFETKFLLVEEITLRSTLTSCFHLPNAILPMSEFLIDSLAYQLHQKIKNH